MSQNLSSAAVVIGTLRVNSPALVMSRSLRLSSRLITQFSMSQIYWKTDKPYKDKHIWASTQENLSSGVCEQEWRRPAPALVMSRSLRLSSRLITQFSMSQIYWKTDKPYKDTIYGPRRENLSSGVSLTHENNRLLKCWRSQILHPSPFSRVSWFVIGIYF